MGDKVKGSVKRKWSHRSNMSSKCFPMKLKLWTVYKKWRNDIFVIGWVRRGDNDFIINMATVWLLRRRTRLRSLSTSFSHLSRSLPILSADDPLGPFLLIHLCRDLKFYLKKKKLKTLYFFYRMKLTWMNNCTFQFKSSQLPSFLIDQ